MKKLLCLMTVLALCLTGCSSKTASTDTTADSGGQTASQTAAPTASSGRKLVAEPLDSKSVSAPTLDKSSGKLQSFTEYANGNFALESMGGNETTTGYTYEKSSAENREIIESYIDLLCDSMYFELIDTYEHTVKSTFLSYALEYTGDMKSNLDKLEMMYNDDVTCDINIWVIIEKNSITELHVNMSSALTATDMGYRYNSTKVDTGAAGTSVAEGLYLNSDGSYETADGRLKTTVGKAVVLRDGVEYTTDAEYLIREDKNDEILYANTFYRTESLAFRTAYNKLLTGDVFLLEDLTIEKLRPPDVYNYAGTTIHAKHGDSDDWLNPSYYEETGIENATVRVFLYDKDDVAVFYMYMKFATEPFELEALAAVDLSDAADNDDDDGDDGGSDGSDSKGSRPCGSCNGGVCNNCGGSGYLYKTGSDGSKIKTGCPSCYNGKCHICGGDGWL